MNKPPEGQTAESRYKRGMANRQTYLTEAHKSSELTLPSLIPDTSDICDRESPVELNKPWQSLGARGVNNLASRLLTSLFPPTSPFLRYQLTPTAKREAELKDIDLGPIQAELSRRESLLQSELDQQGLRSKLFGAIKHLLVAGNVLLRKTDEGIQVFPLNAYVVQRDVEGELIETIAVEKHARATVTDQRILDIIDDPASSIDPDPEAHGPIRVYTSIRRDGKKFRVVQEVGGIEVPGTEETFAPDLLPWLTLRYTSIDGENYGRSFIEEYRGDLTSYESLSRDAVFASANAAKLLWGVDPTSSVNVRQLTNLDNGQFFSAREGEVWALRMDKGGDMQVAQNAIARLEQALSADFLLNSSFQRSGERVTAEEIRTMASELEDTLGGVFSLLGQELQLPLALLLEDELVKRRAIERLDDETVSLGIVTGLAAIGRGQDLTRLTEAITRVAELAPIFPTLIDFIDEGALNTRIWTGSGVDTEGLLRSPEEVEQIRQQKQQAESARIAGEQMAKGAAPAVGQAVASQMAPGTQDTAGE